MNAVLLLFAVGVMLLAGEVFVPGAVLGIIGGLAMAVGCGVAFFQWGALGGAIATVTALGFLGITLYLELVWLPQSRLGRGMVVESTLDATSQPPLATADIVGKMAEAETPLVPTGYVRVEGRRYEAFCPAGHVAKGAMLLVASQDNFRLIVTKT
jgi:membrane-bound serine protease (ClpP class)